MFVDLDSAFADDIIYLK